MTWRETFPIERSRSGLPCLWERGGGATNTGSAAIIADPEGRPKRAIYVRRKGHLSCGEHALIPVRVGDLVIRASHHRGDFDIEIFRIVEISGDEAVVEAIADFRRGEWAPHEPDGEIARAVEAAKRKARCYHCREPHYIETALAIAV
jgi:hypothetical protein